MYGSSQQVILFRIRLMYLLSELLKADILQMQRDTLVLLFQRATEYVADYKLNLLDPTGQTHFMLNMAGIIQIFQSVIQHENQKTHNKKGAKDVDITIDQYSCSQLALACLEFCLS